MLFLNTSWEFLNPYYWVQTCRFCVVPFPNSDHKHHHNRHLFCRYFFTFNYWLVLVRGTTQHNQYKWLPSSQSWDDTSYYLTKLQWTAEAHPGQGGYEEKGGRVNHKLCAENLWNKMLNVTKNATIHTVDGSDIPHHPISKTCRK